MNALISRLRVLEPFARAELALLPTPLHRLRRLSEALGGPEIWIKRDDLTGLAGGGNKTRRLEFLVGDALRSGADTLVTVGALQSNHTRQTAAAAARVGMECALLHNSWVTPPGDGYRDTGNILLSDLLGAELYEDAARRPVEDDGRIDELANHLRAHGRRPYAFPCGGSDHPLGGLGYVVAAAELAKQSRELGVAFDAVVHCTGSSGTQAGLVAGLAALGSATRVIGISDDAETTVKRERVLRLATATLDLIGLPAAVGADDVEITVADRSAYGTADPLTIEAIRLFAETEGLIADPVYEGKAIRGLIDLVERGELRAGQRIVLFHLGGTHAVHAYARQLRRQVPVPFA